MERLLTFALIVVLFLAAAVIAYTFVTNKIIKDQDREIEELRHKIKLKDIKLDYLEKSRAQYKEYFDSHKISSDPASVTFRVINPEGKKVLEDLFKLW